MKDKNLCRKQMLLAPDSPAQRRAENASITDNHQAMKNSARAKLSTDHAIRVKPQQAIPRSSKQIYAASSSHHSECAASEPSPEKTILSFKHRHPLENVLI
jgi:hypothetical protein